MECDWMDGNEIRFVKIVWCEDGKARVVRGKPLGEEDGFFKFQLQDGRYLLLSKAAVVKIEEVPQ